MFKSLISASEILDLFVIYKQMKNKSDVYTL